MDKKLAILLIIIILSLGAYYFLRPKIKKYDSGTPPITTNSNNMKIESSAFQNNTTIPAKYSCDGQEGVNPPLNFSEIPRDTKSLALIVTDPDAQVTGGFVHWIVFNIDPATKEITENSTPQNAIEGTNSASQTKFVCPCPPSGTHRYFFHLYALDDMLSLDPSAKKSDVEKAMEGHVIERAELVGLYKR
jgi:Raf kinase inhibitor-like YbhB/YbcL family protein